MAVLGPLSSEPSPRPRPPQGHYLPPQPSAISVDFLENSCIHEPVVQKMEQLRHEEQFDPDESPIKYINPRHDQRSSYILEAGWLTMGTDLAWLHMKMGWSPERVLQYCEKYYDFIGLVANGNGWISWEITAYFDFRDSAEAVTDEIAKFLGWQHPNPRCKPNPPPLTYIR